MNPEERRSGLPPEVNVGDNRSDGDDEFGEFEGFDGVSLEAIPAAAGPSPWATFPDLLPVQTSPASGATAGGDDPSSGQSQRAPESYDAQMWLGGAIGGAPHLPRSAPVALLQHANRHPSEAALASSPAISFLHQISPRTVNPPDISLSACPSSLPYSALEADLHPSRNSPQQGMVMAPLQPMQQQPPQLLQEQLAALQDQVSALQAQRSEAQERLTQALHQKQELATRLSQSHSQTAELRIHLQEAQDQLREHERKPSNCNSHNGDDLVVSLQQIQESLCGLQDNHQSDRHQIEILSQQVSELKEATERKITRVEQEVGERHNATEWRLTQHITEVGNTLKTTLAATLEEGFRQHTSTIERIITDSLQGLSSEGAGSSTVPQNFSLETLKSYFEHCIVQHRQMLENERRQQLRTVSRTLETMLAQLSSPEVPDSTTMPNTESDVARETSSSNTS